MRFDSVSSSTSNDCGFSSTKHDPAKDDHTEESSVKLQLRRLEINQEKKRITHSAVDLKIQDFTRIQTLHARVKKAKNQTHEKAKKKIPSVNSPEASSGQLVATLESGMTLGSGEYFIDVLVGTPPKHFSLILDTGSDLNWLQCLPCYDCFQQNEPPVQCESDNQSCPYFYWYGDRSNTTGDFAVETFTVNLTNTEGGNSEYKVEDMMFGCGHWNRGLFNGASGLLGLGRGPLSFSSQLQSLYGHSFSYCLVDRNSDTNVSSKLIFGEDKKLLNHPYLNFTSFVDGKENSTETFYYIQIKSILVDGEALDIPEETWNISSDGSGGTIIDSGTTLSYFAEPAYEIIKNKFTEKVKAKYPVFKDFPILDPCFNVSGVKDNNNLKLPELGITFTDGAVWNFPAENSFIWLTKDLVCLAILGTPKSAFSIIGNYQQQNFHILYDTNKSRLGFAHTKCSNI
ncbi:hypothetical protein AALP_AA4G218300 [Arabis alpina]|uniref:Peptidase A1 domain-containing protein n=1 Tax=Arabis alpina TaxID=50452 RepID=A0A087H4T8_ARAAL|nr:hypothetical protein AALP_AA4G218300 [Arabis alpina]